MALYYTNEGTEPESLRNFLNLLFIRSNMELPEQDTDPNLTQMPHQASQSEVPLTVVQPGTSKQKLAKSLNNIASLQTGLQLKRSMAEEDQISRPLPAPSNGALNLLRPQQRIQNKIRPKSFQESVNDLSQDLSQISQDFEDQPIFSTPVRASFRDRLRPRPHTAIHLGEAKTPIKREGNKAYFRILVNV